MPLKGADSIINHYLSLGLLLASNLKLSLAEIVTTLRTAQQLHGTIYTFCILSSLQRALHQVTRQEHRCLIQGLWPSWPHHCGKTCNCCVLSTSQDMSSVTKPDKVLDAMPTLLYIGMSEMGEKGFRVSWVWLFVFRYVKAGRQAKSIRTGCAKELDTAAMRHALHLLHTFKATSAEQACQYLTSSGESSCTAYTMVYTVLLYGIYVGIHSSPVRHTRWYTQFSCTAYTMAYPSDGCSQARLSS